LALGQFVADNPPRATIAIVFFGKACDLGNAEACAYRKRIDEPLSRCADDPFLCGWKAMKTNDLAMYEEACDLGAGDACSSVSFFGGDKQGDLVKSQLYLEKACQLGLPMACQGLADRLSESCESLEGDVVRSCFPVDEALAASARAIACEAGWGDGCTYN
jgi:TPR repeat protein